MHVQDLVELFQELDDNKDGLVTFEEFLNGLRLFKEAVGDQQEQGKILTECGFFCCGL